jgi:heterodisulfide reductase subunit D
MGDPDFVSEAKKRVGQFTAMGIKTIVVSCAGCFKGFHSDYLGLWPEGFEVLHLTQFLDRLITEGRLRPEQEVPMTVTYHDPCHLGRHNRIYDDPRRIIESVPGIRLIEMPRHGAFSACCGMGGGLKVANPDIQHKMSARRIREAEKTGAGAVVTPCQTCYLGLMHGLEEAGSTIAVHHLNELLVRSVCPGVSREAIITAFSRLTS